MFYTTYATEPIFSYIHGGGDTCETSYSYNYDLTHLNKSIRVKFSVDVFARTDADHPSALLFFFKNYQIAEYENSREPDAGNRDLSAFPVRVTYDESGKIAKIETSPQESDSSYHLKKGVVRTLQLDWAAVKLALDGTGPETFDTQIKSKTIECKVSTHIHRAADNTNDFCVHSTRKHTDCNSKFIPTDYEKFKDSKKEWKYHFNTAKAVNFEHLKIRIEDYFKPDENMLISSGFEFKGCNEKLDTWDSSDLQEIHRPLPFRKPETKE